jgi:DNA-binding CsgD family transcriptional regulator
MTPQRRARVVVRARDPRLRSLIVQRLSAAGDLEVAEASEPDALVEAEGLLPDITPREHQVLGLMADGMANKEIAARLGISAHTAKFHVESLLRKLEAANRAEAVHEGIRRGLIGI